MSDSPPRWEATVEAAVEPGSGIVANRSERLVDQRNEATAANRARTDPSAWVAPTMDSKAANPIRAAATVRVQSPGTVPASPGPQATARAESDPLPSLVTGAMRGELDATRSVLVAMGRPVRGACRAILGSGHPDLEDTVQECFVSLIRALPAYRFEGVFSHYALRIAVRTALGARRRARTARSREEQVESAVHDATHDSIPSEQVLAAERRDLLRRLLDELPDVQAQALTMRIIFDLSIEQIAAASGVSVNTVKTRLRLAKDALRRRISGDSVLSTALGAQR